MAITTLSYEAPVRRSTRRETLDYDLLDAAVTLHGEGRPLDALRKVFEHLFPGQPPPDLGKEPFSFTQGSSRVTTRIADDDVSITVPLVRLPAGGGAIAALRHVLSQISATGQLYQPRLHGDDIHLEFKERLTRTHPAKVLEVLRKMPVEADANDDLLIGEFGAQPLERGSIRPLDDAEAARAEKIWRAHWGEVEELVKECQRKRSMFFLNETTAYALHRITFALPLNGIVACRLEEAADTFNDANEDPVKREKVLAKCARDMKAVSGEELRKSLGHADYAISPLDDGTPSALSSYLGPGHYVDTIKKLRTTGKAFDAALALISTYNYLLARHTWPEAIEAELMAGLAEASGKPWKDAAKLLSDHAAALAEKFGATEDEDDDDDDENEDGDDDGEDA